MHASEVCQSYVVLSWKPPSPRAPAPLCYVIEKVCVCEPRVCRLSGVSMTRALDRR